MKIDYYLPPEPDIFKIWLIISLVFWGYLGIFGMDIWLKIITGIYAFVTVGYIGVVKFGRYEPEDLENKFD